MKNKETDRIECAIRHIQTALDVDPWAKDIAIEAMQKMLSDYQKVSPVEWIEEAVRKYGVIGNSVEDNYRKMERR